MIILDVILGSLPNELNRARQMRKKEYIKTWSTVLQGRVVEVVRRVIVAKDIIQKANIGRYPANLLSLRFAPLLQRWLLLMLYI